MGLLNIVREIMGLVDRIHTHLTALPSEQATNATAMLLLEALGELSSNVSPRNMAFDAINSERDYQESLVRNVVNRTGDPTFSPIANLAIIEVICGDMKAEFYSNPGHPSMDYMRKIAATAVRTMESFGSPHRIIKHGD